MAWHDGQRNPGGIGKGIGPQGRADLGLCYNPGIHRTGQCRARHVYPDSILIGESDAKAGDMLQRIYQQMCVNKPPVQRMNFVNAELTKISVNTYVTTKISYANMLADILRPHPGADVDAVTRRWRRHPHRIQVPQGRDGLWRAVLPRDNVAFARFARKLARAPTWTRRRPHQQLPDRRLTSLVGNSPKPARRLPLPASPTSR